jgi:hypothetical protein
MLFKSFILSLIMYCLPVLYPAIYQRDKKDMRKIFKDASSLGLQPNYDLDTVVKTHLKNRVMQIFTDDEHFNQNYLKRCPSGRLRHPKYRTALGKDCFLRQMRIYINNTHFNYFQ